jgi:carbonic anhydrase
MRAHTVTIPPRYHQEMVEKDADVANRRVKKRSEHRLSHVFCAHLVLFLSCIDDRLPLGNADQNKNLEKCAHQKWEPFDTR